MRDSLFGEPILWTGRPKGAPLGIGFRVVAAVGTVLAVVSVASAVVVATGLHAPVGGLLLFAAWCASVALAAWRGPRLWRAEVEYLITDKHVIWRRGRLRRSIERDAISYSLIRWNPRAPGIGDLVLVRAVPTGALRRTLRLTLCDVVGPDRLWAIVRGVTPSAPLGDGHRPLAQRLDEGERVLWTGTPHASRWTPRRLATASIAVFLAAAAVRMITRAAPPLARMLGVHALPIPSFALLVAVVGASVVMVIAVAMFIAYAACLRPSRLARVTRYLVTDRRVLIRRAAEELSVDRSRIAYVIAAPARRLHDVFLVLDGPRARAFASSGAFGGDEGAELRPVLAAIEDAETVGWILRGTGGELRDAA